MNARAKKSQNKGSGQNDMEALTGTSGSALEPLGNFGGEVGNDHISSSTSDSSQYLHDNTLLVDPAMLGGSFDHRVFAAEIISGNRQITMLTYLTNDIEIGQSRFDHNHIGTFSDIQVDFAQGLAHIGRVHLIGATISE